MAFVAKTDWKTGDKFTAEDANRIESGIAGTPAITVEDSAVLPEAARTEPEGSLIVDANGDLYTVESGKTVLKGNVKGPKGDTGAKGAAGAKGDTGAKGDKGDKGDPGADLSEDLAALAARVTALETPAEG